MSISAIGDRGGPMGKPGPGMPVSVDFPPPGGARFSACRDYRYLLWRRWDPHPRAGQVMFVGLNPSTANETKDDPTVRRCIRFARDWRFGGVLVANVYAWRATEPSAMKSAADPVGPENDATLKYAGARADLVVAAWGVHCSEQREEQVRRVIGETLHCLGRTGAGRPRHPLYLRADSVPEPYWAADARPAMRN